MDTTLVSLYDDVQNKLDCAEASVNASREVLANCREASENDDNEGAGSIAGVVDYQMVYGIEDRVRALQEATYNLTLELRTHAEREIAVLTG